MSLAVEEEEQSELNCTLWVGNLDSTVTETILYELFAQAGPIEKIHIPKGKDGTDHKGYCFITFLHDESVPYTINLMEGTALHGKVLKMQPRPGSKHKKMMDAARENEQRIAVQQQQQFQMQQQLPAQGQWYIAPQHPQLAHQYPNMLVYPNQLLQGFPPGLANVNCMSPTLVQFPGMAPQFVNIPMAPQHMPIQQPIPQEHYQYAPRGPRPPNEYRQSRPPRPQMNGYTMHRTPNGNNAQPVASHYSQQSQVLNGSQSSQRYLQSSRGPRPHGGQRFQSSYPPQQTHQPGPRNGNNANGNNAPRMPYSPRNPTHYSQPQPVYTNSVYNGSTSPASGTPIQYQTDRQVYTSPGPRQQNPNFAGNGYHF